jgi:hypothetical protein
MNWQCSSPPMGHFQNYLASNPEAPNVVKRLSHQLDLRSLFSLLLNMSELNPGDGVQCGNHKEMALGMQG